jgi:hypothetical protein
LELLEQRVALSVGGGWTSSTQSSQSGDGFFGQYYSNSSLSGTASFTRWDNRVDFFWPNSNASPGGSPSPGFSSVGPDNWSAKWTGTLIANFSETYTFRINSAANGVRLWVTPVGNSQGNPLIDDWTNHTLTSDTATLTLQAGQKYNVELDLSETTASVQEVQLQWSSPSTPTEDIEPVDQVGLNVDGWDALFANLINGGTRSAWWVPGTNNQYVNTDSNLWPEGDAEILLGEGDTTTQAGGAYLVQFTGMATVTNIPQSVDWVVDGTDLHSSVLQAGQGYNPSTNTTTATMVVPPSPWPGFYISFTNTSRGPNSAMNISSISESGQTVTVSVPSVAGISQNQRVTISGYTGNAVYYNGTYVITSVNSAQNTFTYTESYYTGIPKITGGSSTALVNPQNGITNIYVMQPSTLGGSTPIPAGTLFTPSAISMLSQYTALRFMGLSDTNGNLDSNWSDRTTPSDNFWSAYTFNSGTGVNNNVTGTAPNGVPWEVLIALANQTGKDIYINIPSNSSLAYLTNLADLFAFGSNGVTPYTSVQSDPVWKPLDSNLKVYIEFSNELWNSSFTQSETSNVGWANQLSQRALYDFLTKNQDDPLYPGGGSNAYNDGRILASYYGVNSSNDSAFLSTYNARPGPYPVPTVSPQYFSNAASINGFEIGQGWIGLRVVQISEAFKRAFGETGINVTDTDSRVRPVFEWQYGGGWDGALPFITSVYGSQHPVGYYLYGGGGGWYGGSQAYGFSDVSFANPAFANSLTGWSSSGSAGVVNNGSNMGNPNAPPLMSAIAVRGGATESGKTVTITTTTPHNFVVGQSVVVSGVGVSGYDGTFTITSVASTTFTYQDSTAGLANSGDGIVTGASGATQTAYLQPGASLSQNVTFNGGYADITLYATQTVTTDWATGLTITLTPTNGGPAINNGQPINESEGAPVFSGSLNRFEWARTQAFYTGDSDYTYTVTFTSTLTSGTVFLDTVAIQTVNGIFNETLAAQPNISYDIESDVKVAVQYGIYDVGYEGGYYFDQNLSGYLASDGYQSMGSRGFSSSVPNVGTYAGLDPRTEQLAIDTIQQFYAAGGTLPMVFESTGNTNSWALATPTYFNWNTPKQQAAAAVEQAPHPATYGLSPGQRDTDPSWWLYSGNAYNSISDSTYLVTAGTYTETMSFGANPAGPVGQTDAIELFVDGRRIDTINVPTRTGGSYTVAVGALAAGQHSVELINMAPAGNQAVGLGPYILNYKGSTSPGASPATPLIYWAIPPGPLLFGTPLSESELDAIASVPGTFSYNPALGIILGSGTDTLSLTFTPADTLGYAPVTTTASIEILAADQKATPFVTWANPDEIVYGTALGARQLNATASYNGTPLIGTFTYTSVAGTVPNAGMGQAISVTFTPNDTTDYTGAIATVSINVSPAQLIIAAAPQAKYAGQANPVLTASYYGFVNGDSVATLTRGPALSTNAKTTSGPGKYAIYVGGAAARNYFIRYDDGTLTVGPALVTVKGASIEHVTSGKGGKRKTAKAIVVRFNGRLNPASAQNIANYVLTTDPGGQKAADRIALSAAVYNAAAETVTLTFEQPFVLDRALQLTIRAGGLRDTLGRPIDGNGDGKPGGNYVTTLNNTGIAAASIAERQRKPVLSPSSRHR